MSTVDTFPGWWGCVGSFLALYLGNTHGGHQLGKEDSQRDLEALSILRHDRGTSTGGLIAIMLGSLGMVLPVTCLF